MNIYIDTISIYHDYPKNSIQRNTSVGWVKSIENKGKQSVTCWRTHMNNITIRVYDCIFGVARVFVTCSLPKVVRGNNYWYITSVDVYNFINIVRTTLQTCIITPNDMYIPEFQISRADLFYMHPVEPELKPLYLDAFGKMGNGMYKQSKYINTTYLTCKSIFDTDYDGTIHPASVVIRIYDKDLEMFNRLYPESVHEDFKHCQYTEYVPPNYIRLEISMLRPKLVKRIGKGNNSVTLWDLLFTFLPMEILNDYFESLGFYNKVLSAKSFRSEAKKIFSTDKTYNNAINSARLIRNDRTPNISSDALRYVKKELHSNGISLITTSKHNLKTIDKKLLDTNTYP